MDFSTISTCCAYLRKSREDEERERYGKGETLARHQRMIERLADGNGHEIAQWYREIVSGETISGRPEMQRLLKSIASGLWDAVYVVEASRLGRGGGSDQEKIVNAFRYTDTWLITQSKVYDPKSPADMRQLKGELRSSEDELESITTRLVRGRADAALEGSYLTSGRAPFGWRSVRIKGMWTLEPDENHGNMLRIYDMLDAGLGYSAIADVFNSEGILTLHGGKKWTPTAIRQIAGNPVNCGMITYGRRKTQRVFDPETFEVHKETRLSDDYIQVRGLHYGKGGISEERFSRIAASIQDAARVKRGHELVNPLAGLIKCGRCGFAMDYKLMSSGKSKAYFYSHYSSSHRFKSGYCKAVRGARASLVLDALAESLERTAKDVEIRLSSNDALIEQHREHMKALETARRSAVEARLRAMEAFEAGAYSVEDLAERKADIDARIARIDREIATAKPPEYTQETVETLRGCIEAIKDDGVSPKEKNDFLKRIIKRIDYYNDTPKFVLPNRIRLEVFLK